MIAAIRKGGSVAAVVLMASATTLAQTPNDSTTKQDKVPPRSETRTPQNLTVFQTLKCSELEDTTVKNTAGQDLGHISDFAVDPNSGRVAYAALSFGGLLEMGDKLFAIPLSALDVQSRDRVVLDVSKSQLENMTGFDQENWPLQANNQLGTATSTTTTKSNKRIAANERITSVKKASDIIGMEVKNPQGEELGTISDLHIDPDHSYVGYAVLSHGGWLGVGDKLFAIPWGSFTVGTGEESDTLVLNVSRSRLETAPAATADQNDTWNDRDWVINVYKFYHVDPYWDKTESQKITMRTDKDKNVHDDKDDDGM